MNNDLRNVEPTITKQEGFLAEILDESDFRNLMSIKDELKDTWLKKQLFRTETEMRYSVLNNGSFPTKASKYWQCVREQNVFFENLMILSFEYRKNNVEIKKINRKMEQESDDLELELLQIELEEKCYHKASMELVAKDRMRELEHWSRIKKELDDGSFDTKNVNTHQKDSLKKQLEHRLSTLSASSPPGEISNVLGPLNTILEDQNLLK